MLQVILLIMEGTEKSETSYDTFSYWDRLPSYSACCSHRKSSWITISNKMLYTQYFFKLEVI